MVKSMKLLGNLSYSLVPQQKHLIYRSCVLPITLYDHQLQFYNKALLVYPIRELNKTQYRAAIWILRVFCTSFLFGIKAIVGFISIKLHFQKLCNRSQLRVYSLLHNHILRSLLESLMTSNLPPYRLSLVSRLLTMDLAFIFTFHFILFCFVFLLFFFFFFYFQNNLGQGSPVMLLYQLQN